MPTFRVERELDSGVVATGVRQATGLSQLWGLLTRSKLDPHEGLWLVPCRSIHTLFMRFPIDAVFLSRELRIVELRPALQPWRVVLPPNRATHSVLELCEGAVERAGLEVGHSLTFQSF